jgi:L-seryl-tRNA(Ser) seleniumtransferase
VKTASKSDLLRELPSVDELLRGPALAEVVGKEGHAAAAEAARSVLARLRNEITAGRITAKDSESILASLDEAVIRELNQSLTPSLCAVVNATGVILHTNLGRAPIASSAIEHLRDIATGYSNLEFDLGTGERGRRDTHAGSLFEKLFAQQIGHAAKSLSTIVVNNNAAAVLLAVNTLGEGGEAVVSRGELVEIGGSFRVPEVMAKAGVALREVGTTNRTRIGDYERAINVNTRVLLRVHRSNFAMVGFTEQPALKDLVALAHKHRLPLLEDLGSGALFDLRHIGISGEPEVAASLRAGVDLVTYSGDKLLGGPQAGMLTGKKEVIAHVRQNPLFRALRVDKLTYSTLEATLLAYIRQDHASIPAVRMMQIPADDVRQRAQAIMTKLSTSHQLRADVAHGESVIGGGAAPGATLPTFVVALTHKKLSADELAAALRSAKPLPIIARVEDGRVLLDLRTVFQQQDEYVLRQLRTLAAQES